MKIKFVLFLCCSVLLKVTYSQELIEFFEPQMIRTDSLLVYEEQQGTKGFIYYDSLGEEVSFFRYTASDELLFYQFYDIDSNGVYQLDMVAWNSGGNLNTYVISGPSFYRKSYTFLENGSEVSVNINSEGKGTLVEVDSMGIIVRSALILYDEYQYRTFFTVTGTLRSTFTSTGGYHYGKYYEYNEHGTLIVEGNYPAYQDLDRSSGSKELRSGYWYFYNHKGKLIRTELYENGELIRSCKGKMKVSDSSLSTTSPRSGTV